MDLLDAVLTIEADDDGSVFDKYPGDPGLITIGVRAESITVH